MFFSPITHVTGGAVHLRRQPPCIRGRARRITMSNSRQFAALSSGDVRVGQTRAANAQHTRSAVS